MSVSSVQGSSHDVIESAVILFYTSSSDCLIILQEYVTRPHILPSKVGDLFSLFGDLGGWQNAAIDNDIITRFLMSNCSWRLLPNTTIRETLKCWFWNLKTMPKLLETCALKLNQMLQQNHYNVMKKLL